MKVSELIELLSQHPADAIVSIYDPDAADWLPATGVVHDNDGIQIYADVDSDVDEFPVDDEE